MYSILLSIIFITIAFIHFYWAFGGNWARLKVVPCREDGSLLFMPKFAACFLVAVVFLVFVLLVNYNLFYFMPKKVSHLSLYVIMALFLLRSIGDFRYVGMFKRIRNTPFAKKDNLIYSPLCLVVVILMFLHIYY